LRRFTPLVLLLFVGSGCAALIYEVVWFHLMRLIVGGSAVSLGLLLASFMGGMGLGSFLLPRVLPARWHPLRVYAGLELGIAALGYAMPLLLPALGRAYVEHGGGSVLFRGALCALALVPPTMLMGATLPAIARWLDTSRPGLAAMGSFYAANIAGAVAGTLLAGFYLLRVFDTQVASHVAVGVNVLVAAVALVVAGREHFVPATDTTLTSPPSPSMFGLLALALALSGLCALAAEVIWTRLLSLLFGASVYTFALILAVFLTALGAGSALGARLARTLARPRIALGCCQLLVVPAVIYSAWMITAVIPRGAPNEVFQPRFAQAMAVHFTYDFARCLLAIAPAPLLWGMSFPLAVAAAAGGRHDPGRLVGGLSAANTLGAILGALAASLTVEVLGGSARQQQVVAALAGATGVGLLAATLRSKVRRAATVALGVSVIAALTLCITPVPPGLIASGRTVADWHADFDYLLVREGINSSVAVTEGEGVRSFHVCGKVEASSQRIDMRLQRMLGHLPALVHGDPKRVLIVGCGAGVTAGCFVDHPGVERIVICEIEPNVLTAARDFFGAENRDVLRDPRTHVVCDDARHFLLTTAEKFDVITSDPIHPWVRGAAALYSLDYFALVQHRLNPGAVVTQWVPLYETDEAAVKSQLATFFAGFPHGSIWHSDLDDQGYDTVVMATRDPLVIDVDAIAAYLATHHGVSAALAEVDLDGAVALLSTYAGRAQDLAPWLLDAQINDDVGLKLQYLAGLRLDLYRDVQIFTAMKRYARYPDGLFTASPAFAAELRQKLTR
jgi:spermidine synthase